MTAASSADDRVSRVLAFALDPDTYAALDRAAGDRLLSPSEFAKRLLADALLPQTTEQPT